MTDEMMNLKGLVEKSPDADFLREMIGFAAQRLMELEVEGQTGAAYGEKSPERLAQRNGYRERIWETRAGAVELRIPKLRKAAVEAMLLVVDHNCPTMMARIGVMRALNRHAMSRVADSFA